MLTRKQIEQIVKFLLKRYDAEYALLFGSYARGEETPESDIDIIGTFFAYWHKSGCDRLKNEGRSSDA